MQTFSGFWFCTTSTTNQYNQENIALWCHKLCALQGSPLRVFLTPFLLSLYSLH